MCPLALGKFVSDFPRADIIKVMVHGITATTCAFQGSAEFQKRVDGIFLDVASVCHGKVVIDNPITIHMMTHSTEPVSVFCVTDMPDGFSTVSNQQA